MKTKKEIEDSLRREKPKQEFCANCGKPVDMSDYSMWCRVIMKEKPACSFECNKALGQIKS